jgi:hypothetical protein
VCCSWSCSSRVHLLPPPTPVSSLRQAPCNHSWPACSTAARYSIQANRRRHKRPQRPRLAHPRRPTPPAPRPLRPRASQTTTARSSKSTGARQPSPALPATSATDSQLPPPALAPHHQLATTRTCSAALLTCARTARKLCSLTTSSSRPNQPPLLHPPQLHSPSSLTSGRARSNSSSISRAHRPSLPLAPPFLSSASTQHTQPEANWAATGPELNRAATGLEPNRAVRRMVRPRIRSNRDRISQFSLHFLPQILTTFRSPFDSKF